MVAAGPAGWTMSRSQPSAGTVVLASNDVPVLRQPRGRGREAQGAQGEEGLRDPARAACRCGSGTTTSARTRPGCSPARWRDAGTPGDEPTLDLTDLTPEPGRALVEGEYDVSPDGSTVVTTWALREPGGLRYALALIDVATGDLTVVLDDVESEYDSPRFSPDGRSIALVREMRSTPHDPGDRRLAVYSRADGSAARPHRRLGPLARGLAGVDPRRVGARARGRRGRPRAGVPASTSPAASSPG